MTVVGRLVGPDDQPVQDVWIIGRAAIHQGVTAWRTWLGYHHGHAPSGRFQLHGLDPDSDLPVYFFQPKRRLGATVQISGKSAADGPMTVRLQPCGTAMARLIDGHGQPVAGYHDDFLSSMIITPAPDQANGVPAGASRLNGHRDLLARIDPINYAKAPVSDAQGLIVFPALIPGASYHIREFTTKRDPSGSQGRQGLHCQTRRNPVPWRYPDREAASAMINA